MRAHEAAPDIAVPFRVVVIEETDDPIPPGAIHNHYGASNSVKKLIKIVKSVPFKVFTRGLPCKQRIVFERPIEVAKGQFLAIANMKGTFKRRHLPLLCTRDVMNCVCHPRVHL